MVCEELDQVLSCMLRLPHPDTLTDIDLIDALGVHITTVQ